MQNLTATSILDIWESGQGLTTPEQALLLLERALPLVHSGEQQDGARLRVPVESLPIGRRDALLFELRSRLFGPHLDAVTECPSCDRQLEMALNITDLPLQKGNDCEYVITMCEGEELRFRLPTTRDLLAVAEEATEEDAARKLLQCCMLERERSRDGKLLPEEVQREVADRLAEADPLTDLTFAMCCPLCDHHWNETFDIVSWLWSEIDTAARTLLDEVHHLASAYGWSESQILALSAARRAHYLTLIDAYTGPATSSVPVQAGRRRQS